MLASLNAGMAAIIIFGGGALGWLRFHEQNTTAGFFGIMLGLLAGFIIAALTCGTLATLLLIENHLRNLVAHAEHKRRTQKQ
ncbi:hypothetical protein [Mesorhizobium australicum]|uniref:hypothetical protein n=1 Tax=Mesorhizobium australicum TaxID=536018 RepID=UPI00333559A6